MPPRTPALRAARARAFSARAFLDVQGGAATVSHYERGDHVFSQGDAGEHVLYIRSGSVAVSARSTAGQEAVLAVFGPRDFFGEGCLAGQLLRTGSAVVMRPSAILSIARETMARLLHRQHGLSDRFISHMLTRNIRMEEDLVGQLFGAGEMRLARSLLRMARYGKGDRPVRTLPGIAEKTLGEMAGTTGARATGFLERFRRLGFIDCHDDGRLTINRSLLKVVLQS
jgi:CRP-like cAMP-binding protein